MVRWSGKVDLSKLRVVSPGADAHQGKKSKYNSKITEYNGVKYHSKAEANHAQKLDLLKKGGLVERWERQHKIRIELYGKHFMDYKVDFKVFFVDGHIEYHEVKGFPTRDFKIVWNLLSLLKDEILGAGDLVLIRNGKEIRD